MGLHSSDLYISNALTILALVVPETKELDYRELVLDVIEYVSDIYSSSLQLQGIEIQVKDYRAGTVVLFRERKYLKKIFTSFKNL